MALDVLCCCYLEDYRHRQKVTLLRLAILFAIIFHFSARLSSELCEREALLRVSNLLIWINAMKLGM